MRPKLSELLPRQGVPPPLRSWEHLAAILAWGAASGNFATARTWWWELRRHLSYGTLEFRVPGAQSSVRDAIAIAAVTQGLVAWLGDRHDAGEHDHVADVWVIEENRWSACRYGVTGTMADLRTGRRRDTRECLLELLETLRPIADRPRGDIVACGALPGGARRVEQGNEATPRGARRGLRNGCSKRSSPQAHEYGGGRRRGIR